MSTVRDESAITEISIAPDGRVYVFGASAEVLEVMAGIAPGDRLLAQRIRHARGTAAEPLAGPTGDSMVHGNGTSKRE